MPNYKLPPFIREPSEVYHAKGAQHLGSHALADYAWCPAYHKQKASGLIGDRDSDAYSLGSAAHCLTLEGRKQFEASYIVGGPINPKTKRQYGKDTKAFGKWAAQQTKSVLADDEFALVCHLDYSVRSHPEAKQLLAEGIAEGVLRTTYCGIACQVRVDWFSPEFGLVDLKTCDKLDRFEDDIRFYKYVEQMSFYRSVLAVITGQLVPVHLIAVEKQVPYRCGVWQLATLDLEAARLWNEAKIAELLASRASGDWPTNYESTRIYTRFPSR